MDKLSLYGVIDELDNLENCIDKIDSIEDQEVAASRMNELIGYLQEKTDACYYFNLSMEDQIAAHDKLIKELQSSRDKIQGKTDKFSKYIIMCMDKIGVKKLSGKFFQIIYRTPTLILEIYDESLIPSEYFSEVTDQVTKRVYNKTAIKDLLLLGAEIQGARLKESNRSAQFKVGVKKWMI